MNERKRGEVVSPEEIAQRLGLGINQVYAGLNTGELPGRRVGRRWIVTRAVFERFMAGEPNGGGASS